MINQYLELFFYAQITYLSGRPVPQIDLVTGIDEIFYNTRAHNTESQETEGQVGRLNLFTLQSIRNVVNINGWRTLRTKQYNI